MVEPDGIVEVLADFFAASGRLSGKKVFITAGPTYEKIDPVRFIGNYSSGKMGFALAETCARRGADVTLVTGPTSLHAVHAAIKRIDVESANDMYRASLAHFHFCDIAVLCAAVADYRPLQQADEKIRSDCYDEMTLTLVRNEDIAATLGKMKQPHQTLVGFALETNDGLDHAKEKLLGKNLDMIVLNSLQDEGAGFGCDTNKVTLIDKAGTVTAIPLQSKQEVAEAIIDYIVSCQLK
jgi:phosphopantothenoylcysteine decarboxylase/phosphopantothenate--cysteine ligase